MLTYTSNLGLQIAFYALILTISFMYWRTIYYGNKHFEKHPKPEHITRAYLLQLT